MKPSFIQRITRFGLPILTAIMFLLSSIVTHAQDFSAFEKHVFEHALGEMPYRLLKPLDYDPNKEYPLVLFLHGSGERGNDNEAQMKNGVAAFLEESFREKYNAFVVVPQGPKGERWSPLNESGEPSERFYLSEAPSRPMRMLTDMLEAIKQEYSIDSRRLYITGVSMGGQGTYDFLIRHPEMFAAAAIVCSSTDIRKVSAIAELPLWIFHGEEDTVVPVDQARVLVTALEKAGGKPRYTEYPEVGHNSWDFAYQEPKLFAWMFSKKSKKRS